MSTFHLSSNNLFVHYMAEALDPNLFLFEYTTDPNFHPNKISPQWIVLEPVGPNKTYNALEVQGVILQGNTLQQLTNDLKTSGVFVNREGLCFLDENAGTRATRYALQDFNYYLKLNDLFPWSKYGVTVPQVTTVWNRIDYHTNRKLVDFEDMQKKLSDSISKVTNLEIENSNCKKRLSDSMSKVTNLEIENSNSKKKLSESMLKVTNLEIENYKYKKQLEEKNKMIEELKEKTIHDLSAVITYLSISL